MSHFIENIEQLEALYGQPGKASLIKEVAELIPQYRVFVEASPFCTIATIGPGGSIVRRAATGRALCGFTMQTRL